MINKKLKLAILFGSFAAGYASAASEVGIKIIHENADFISGGSLIGASADNAYDSTTYKKHSTGDTFKSESTAKVTLDGDLVNSAYHVELNLHSNPEAVDGYSEQESYTQRDGLREAYIDTQLGDWALRTGKQQVVWGTADGMKLLDNINPTDYSELAQNQMADSRIPVWMLNAETNLNDGGTFQFIASEAKGHKIAGLGNTSAKGDEHTNGDSGHPFIMKGVDTLVGPVNGFLNIAPALGQVATSFSDNAGGNGSQLAGAYAYTVQGFVDGNAGNFKYFCTGAVADADCLAKIANNATNPVNPVPYGFANNLGGQDHNKHNLIDAEDGVGSWDHENPNSMFEYMYDATFATFDTFTGMTSEYRVEEAEGGNLGFRYKNTTSNGLNYSLNFLNHIDPNPYVQIHYEKQDGTRLYEKAGSGNFTSSVELCTTNATCSSAVGGAAGYIHSVGDFDNSYAANMVMTEKYNRINSLGGSFDYAIESDSLGPIVIRGEAVYDMDTMQPVLTRKSSDSIDLHHGFFANSFTPTEADMLKYVLGFDVTALTNMMVSLQLIQISNLDFIDQGNKDTATWKYTADAAVMSLTNNLQKAKKNKEFYSLFLSKPFGESGQHRWNNITIYEEDGGYWNRLDAEYTIDDNTQATAEYNLYGGNENTQFGQFYNSSNVQIGFKYSF